jgi:uroporphyrinogen-III synthase
MMAGGLPLTGHSILLTRPAERSATLARRLGELGARVESRPTVRLVPPEDSAPAERAVAQLHLYDWVVFTSVNGVRYFCETVERIRRDSPPMSPSVAAIGPATARALEERGVSPDVQATESQSEGLAKSLRDRVRPNQRVLLVRPQQARHVLPAAIRGLGASVDAVPFYRNVPAPEVDSITHDLRDGRFDVVVFASPSALQHLLQASHPERSVTEALRSTSIVAIGRVTAAALEEAGLCAAAIASEPSDDGIIEAVRRLLER